MRRYKFTSRASNFAPFSRRGPERRRSGRETGRTTNRAGSRVLHAERVLTPCRVPLRYRRLPPPLPARDSAACSCSSCSETSALQEMRECLAQYCWRVARHSMYATRCTLHELQPHVRVIHRPLDSANSSAF